MKLKLHWKKHGDLYVAVDAHGWPRYIIYRGVQWESVGPLGMEGTCKAELSRGPNRRRLQRDCADEWRIVSP
jgi:hypothetical protein